MALRVDQIGWASRLVCVLLVGVWVSGEWAVIGGRLVLGWTLGGLNVNGRDGTRDGVIQQIRDEGGDPSANMSWLSRKRTVFRNTSGRRLQAVDCFINTK